MRQLVLAAIGLAVLGATPTAQADVTVLRGGRVIDVASGNVSAPMDVTMRGGRITSLANAGAQAPAGADEVDVSGRFLLPGLLATHVHVSDVDGLKPRAYTAPNTHRQLALYGRYGITSVWSLGGEQAPAFEARRAQAAGPIDRARIFLAGEIVASATPEAARADVARIAATQPDWIKIRVDDNLGISRKMPPEVYRAVIEEAHARGLRVTAHIFYLEDGKGLLRAGVDMIGHSVRDRPVDDEFIALLKARDVPYSPTLTREVSTFVYESEPAFFSDPFFLRDADPAMIARLREPDRQAAMAANTGARAYKAALPTAMANLKRLSDAGVTITMGTDSGALPERFQGFFEHLEMEMMVQAGMTPLQVLRSATIEAARAMRVPDLGRLAPGAHADVLVLDRNPLENILHTRAIHSVWISGRRLP
jgi:imidazolonepropionase-like amidohydrolase